MSFTHKIRKRVNFWTFSLKTKGWYSKCTLVMALMNNEYAYFSSFFEKKNKNKNTCVHEKARGLVNGERSIAPQEQGSIP